VSSSGRASLPMAKFIRVKTWEVEGGSWWG
jgi:hypothetical protein